MPGKKLSPDMLAFLEHRGLTPPPTFPACTRLINYVRRGNGTIGDNEEHRIDIVKRYAAKWVGKQVRSRLISSERVIGEVTHLVALYRGEVYIKKRDAVLDGDDPKEFRMHPFRVAVRWKNDSSQCIPTFISLVELVGSEG